MAGFLYMLSLLYADENFETVNELAKFDATVTMGGFSNSQNFIISSSLNKSTGKIVAELIVSTASSEQYSYVEIDYNFATDKLVSFRFICNNAITDTMNATIDMGLTELNEYKWFETTDISNDFASAVINKKNMFLVRSQTVSKLTTDFSSTVQTYFNVVQEVLGDLGVM